MSSDSDISGVNAAINDVADGKPLKLKEAEMQPLLEQGRQYSLYTQGAKNREEGAAFLAAKAKEPGVKVLTNSLLYKVVKEGNGRPAISLADDEVFFIKWKGSFIDG